MKEWLLVAVIVAATAAADVLQSREMRAHGEVTDFRPSGLAANLQAMARRPMLFLAIFCMAVSFFAFMVLVSVSDLSFAVPATAASFVVETFLAQYVLKERVDGRRWLGALLVAAGVALLAV